MPVPGRTARAVARSAAEATALDRFFMNIFLLFANVAGGELAGNTNHFITSHGTALLQTAGLVNQHVWGSYDLRKSASIGVVMRRSAVRKTVELKHGLVTEHEQMMYWLGTSVVMTLAIELASLVELKESP